MGCRGCIGLALALAALASCGSEERRCERLDPHVLVDVEGEWMPRCELGDWPLSFEPPPPIATLPESLPPPFDRPDEPAEAVGGAIFTLGTGSRGDFGLQTIWTDDDHPPTLRLGLSSRSEGRLDIYCLVDGIPSGCRWNDEEASWLAFEDFDPVRAWTIELLDPPHRGFDWTVLWIRQVEEGIADGSIERLYVFDETVDVRPRFEPILWELATPEFRGANVSAWVVPQYTPVARDADRVRLDVEIRNSEACTIPVEITFLAEGNPLRLVMPDPAAEKWSLEAEPGQRIHEVELEGVGAMPPGSPLIIHGLMYPGVPGFGLTESGEQCAAASAGMMQGFGYNDIVLLE